MMIIINFIIIITNFMMNSFTKDLTKPKTTTIIIVIIMIILINFNVKNYIHYNCCYYLHFFQHQQQ